MTDQEKLNKMIHEARVKLRASFQEAQNILFETTKKLDDYLAELRIE